uniref:hypothetical protein n=1 Tax=Enterobacter cancerogenus TaxID=69218 RepID=UPI001C3DC31C
MLGLNFVLMVIPGANGGINKAAKEKQETDKQYDAGHALSLIHISEPTKLGLISYAGFFLKKKKKKKTNTKHQTTTTQSKK